MLQFVRVTLCVQERSVGFEDLGLQLSYVISTDIISEISIKFSSFRLDLAKKEQFLYTIVSVLTVLSHSCKCDMWSCCSAARVAIKP